MDTLLLRSSDSFLLMISIAAAKLSVPLRMTIENRYPDMDLIIPVTGVDADTLDKVIEWMEHHKFDAKSTQWDREFFAGEPELWQLTLAAHFLEIDDLLAAIQHHYVYKATKGLASGKSLGTPRNSLPIWPDCDKGRQGDCEGCDPERPTSFEEFKSMCESQMADHLEEAKNLYDLAHDEESAYEEESDNSEASKSLAVFSSLKIPSRLPTPIPPWHFLPGYQIDGEDTVWTKVPLKMVKADDIEDFNENGRLVDNDDQTEESDSPDDISYAGETEHEYADIPSGRKQYSNNVSCMFMLSLPGDMVQATSADGPAVDTPYTLPVFANKGRDGGRGRIIPFNGNGDNQIKCAHQKQQQQSKMSEDYAEKYLERLFLEPLKRGRNGIYELDTGSDDISIYNLFND